MTEGSKARQLAKNTAFLYLRTIIILVISLYTSRVVLDALGTDDFGIYSVVGGFVVMFSILSSSLVTAINRYLAFELGRGDIKKLKIAFSTSLSVQIILAILIIILGEVVGVWFLNTQMNIPEDRMVTANWVLQCSLLTFVINIVGVPYNACIVAHERMNVFAYISMLEVSLKLFVVFLLSISSFDKLILYAILILFVTITIQLVYLIYCKRNFQECSYLRSWDNGLVSEMSRFAGWNLFANASYIFNTQGVNLVINVFFGVTINAARGIATQVENAITSFVKNFVLAMTPQITKAYAEGDSIYLNKLIISGAKYTYYMFLFFAIPFLLETNYVISLWLKNVPNHTISFVQLALICNIIDNLGNTGYFACVATGKMKQYVIYMSTIGCLVFPFTWIAYYIGMPAEATYIINALIVFLCMFIRLAVMKRLLNFSPKSFIIGTLQPCLLVSLFVFIIPFCMKEMFSESFIRLVLVCFASEISLIACVWFLGLNNGEKANVKQAIRNRISHIAR